MSYIIRKSISFQPDVLENLDNARGDIKRSTLVNEILRRSLDEGIVIGGNC